MSVDGAESRSAEQLTRDLASLVESSSDAILQVDIPSAVITYWNPAAEQMFGISASEALGHRAHDVFIPVDRVTEADDAMAAASRGEVFRNPNTVRRRADGSTFHASVTVTPVRDAAGRIVAASSIIRDVTDQVRAEQDLAAEESRHRVVLETASEGILMLDEEGRIGLLNGRCQELLGEHARPGRRCLTCCRSASAP